MPVDMYFVFLSSVSLSSTEAGRLFVDFFLRSYTKTKIGTIILNTVKFLFHIKFLAHFGQKVKHPMKGGNTMVKHFVYVVLRNLTLSYGIVERSLSPY